MKRAALAFAATTAALAAGLTLPVRAAPDGAAIYARCAACHTKTGAGVPGVFPPLGEDFRVMAASEAGRRYLALVVTRGVSGPIKVGGKPYAGVMPAQATLDDASVAAVLNHVGTEIARTGPAFKPFAEGELAAIRASGAALSAQDVGKLHAGAGGQ
ncbi:cytochrome c [Novosphingobium sp.]|uniref:c-type cytochrome n=1 Tax=Novosphingobium sp. TaxID=1874826 RepID=UPI0026075254|nr:cytochrome c [Novosphingobium sp.]